MQADALVETARDHLLGFGLDCSLRHERSPLVAADATLALRWRGGHQRFAVHAMTSVRLAAVLSAAAEAGSAAPVLIVAPWISPRIGAQLREIGTAYVDSVGNASLRFATVLIEVSGRQRPARGGLDTASPGGSGSSTGVAHDGRVASAGERIETRAGRLLTPANRRVIAALLAEPLLESAPLRELAAAAEVSVGQAHKSVALLAAAGYHRGHLDEAQRAALAGVLEALRGFER